MAPNELAYLELLDWELEAICLIRNWLHMDRRSQLPSPLNLRSRVRFLQEVRDNDGTCFLADVSCACS